MIAAMRQLQAELDRVDRATADALGLARSDCRALTMLTEGPLTPRALAAGLGLTSGSVTALIDRLAARGLVTRAPDPADRRGVLVAATPLAAMRLRVAQAPLAEAVGRLAARYGNERSGAAGKQMADVARIAAWAAARIEQSGAG